jgi:hypothetical protein
MHPLIARGVVVVVRVEVELDLVGVVAEKLDVDLVVLAVATVVPRAGIGEERGHHSRFWNRLEAGLVAAVSVEADRPVFAGRVVLTQ